MGIFDAQLAFKPFLYKPLLKYREAIRLSRWDVEEFEFSEDVHDFKTKLDEFEQQRIKRSMLIISQIEAANVKDFWGNIGHIFPRSEAKIVGYTFSENEITHSLAYSQLLEVLGFNNEFEELLKNPVIKDRVNYLNKYINKDFKDDKQQYLLILILFTLFVENVSLFSQFLIIKSFKKEKNLLQSIDSVILATQKDELCHAQFGIELINIVRKEHLEWFTPDFYASIYKACKKALKAEEQIIDWIYEGGNSSILPVTTVKEFIKNRFNESLLQIGGENLFKINQETLQPAQWFNEEIYAYVRNDFFNSKSANYNKVSVKFKDIKNSINKIKNELV